MIILLLILLTLAVYWQVQNFGFINYDDNLYITQNHKIKSPLTLQSMMHEFRTIHAANWHPLTMLSHRLDWQIFGEQAGGHHWTSLILHTVNTVLLFLLLNRMTGAVWRSALVAALFAVHPINVESVAWVSERKNVLSTFCWFLTMIFYVGYIRRPGWWRYGLVILSFALGLMSKPMLVTLPFVLLLMDYWPLNRTGGDARPEREVSATSKVAKDKWSFLILEKMPLFALTLISIVATLYAQRTAGAVVDTALLPLTKRILNAVVTYGLYIRKMVWPLDLSVFYPRYKIGIYELLPALCVLILLSVVALWSYRKRRYLLVGWLWFLGTLVPVIGLVQVGVQSMADRYAYVPFIGLFIMAVWAAADCSAKSKYIRGSLAVISLGIIVALSILAWQRCQLWGDPLSLWNDVIKNHKVSLAYNLRGLAYAQKGERQLALSDYNMAITLDSKCTEAFNNRAVIYSIFGERTKALHDYDRAVKLNPKYADAFYNRGLLYLENNRLEAAIADFSSAIHIGPAMSDYYHYRGVARRLKGRHQESFEDFNQAIKMNPTYAEAFFNRGIVYQMHQQHVPAIANFSEALRIKPTYVEARFSRGVSFAFLDRHDQAAKDFVNVLRRDSKHIEALNHLGIVLKKMEKYGESSDQYEKILQIKPGDQDAINALSELKTLRKNDRRRF